MRKHIGSKLIAVFMSFCMVIAFMPGAAFTAYADSTGQNSVVVNDQTSLNDAVAAAGAGDVVEIATAGTYKIPNLPNNVTVKGTADGVVFDCAGSGSVASVPNGATFENVTMNFGASAYHGFQHAGTINMVDCTLNGLFFSYGDMNFDGCTFNAPGSEYSMWAYSGNLSYTDCTFNGAGKFINVYNESGAQSFNIMAEGCTFISTAAKKAAFNVKETSGSNILKYSIDIENCTCEGEFPAASTSDALVVISPLVQVDDRKVGGTPAGGEVEVTLDGEKVYSSEKKFAADENGVYHIATADQLVKFAGLVNSGANASSAVLDADIDMSGVDFTPIGTSKAFGGTFDGNGKTISNLSVSTEGGYSGLFGRVQGTETLAVIKNLTIKDSEAKTTWENDEADANYVGMIAGHMYAKVENCTVSNCSVEGKDQVGGITGFVYGGYIENCTVEDTVIKANGDRAGGIAGKAQANDNCKIDGNTVDTCTVSAAKTYKGLGSAAALVGQIMPGPKFYITNNNVIDTETVTESDDTFNPIGYFRDFDANAITNGNIAGNSWAPMTTPNSFKMVNPADTTQYIVVKNANQPKVAKIGDTEYTSLQEALDDAVKGGDVTVEIIDDIDLSDTVWNPVAVRAPAGLVTVNGNNHVINGLDNMLFSDTWAGKSGLVINDLTIRDSAIVNDKNDEKNIGVGAFVGYPQASETVTLSNCHLIDSTVEGGHWTGGLVGACAGYNGNDGPVFTTLTITGCSVEGCEIIGPGSAGSFIGHASQNVATKVILEGEAIGNSISGEKAAKTGKLIGTIGAAGGSAAFNGETGAIELDVVESGNTGATNVAGRIGTNGGTMIVTGGSYESDPLVTSDNAIGTLAAKEGFTITENNGVYALVERVAQVGDQVYGSLEEAVAAVEAGGTVTLLADAAGNGIKIDKDVTIDFDGHTYTVDGELAGSAGTKTQGFQLLKDNNVTFKNGTVTSEKAKMLVQNYSNLTLDNMVLDGSSLVGTAPYTLSTNNGNTAIKDTKIVAKDGGFAFDVCSFGSYEANAVTVEGESVIEGKVELSSENDVAVALDLQAGDFSKAELVVSEGGEAAEVTKADSVKFAAPDGYAWDEGKLVVVQDLKDQIAELEGQVEELNKQVEDITDQLESANADKEQLTKELEEVTAAKEELETELAELQAKLTEAEGDNADLQARLDQAAEDIAALEKSVEDANKAIDDKDSRIAKLTEQIDALIESTGTLAETNKELTETVKAKTEQVEKLNKDITALNEQIADITDQLEDANADKEQLTKELSDVTAAKEKAEADLKAAKDELTAAEAGIEELQGKLEAEGAKAADLQAKLTEAEGNNEALKADLEKAAEEIAALEKGSTDTMTELNKAQETIAALEKSVEDANSELNAAQKEIEELKAKLAEKVVPIKYVTIKGIKAKTYTGKKRYQKPVLTFCGKTLEKGVDYTVKYTNNTKVGKATVVFTGIGEDFNGTVKKTFKINPKKTSIVKVTKAKKAFTVKWKKKTVQTSGYQIKYSLKSSMSNAKIKTVKGTKTTSKKISKLKAKKKYYVKVRTYKTVNGKKYYSSWSAKKSVTTK